MRGGVESWETFGRGKFPLKIAADADLLSAVMIDRVGTIKKYRSDCIVHGSRYMYTPDDAHSTREMRWDAQPRRR